MHGAASSSWSVAYVAYVAVTIERSLWKMAELPAPTAPPCCLRLSDPQEKWKGESFIAVLHGNDGLSEFGVEKIRHDKP